MDTTTGAGTAAVVALKAGDAVKSRLGVLPELIRLRLAWAMAVDTLRALSAAVEHLLVVTDRPGTAEELHKAGVVAEIVPEPGGTGLNEALRHGDTRLRSDGWSTVLACVGDLPSLRPASVLDVIMKLGTSERAFVPDRSGLGTTMVLAHGVALDPRFQGESARAHRNSGARPLLDVAADARFDVDTVEDLAAVIPLGLGPTTAALMAESAVIKTLLGPG